MAIPVLEDLIVPENDVRTYVQNIDYGYATALWMGAEGYYEPSLINRGEIHLGNPSGLPGILIYFSSAFFWKDAVVENYGLISAVDIFDVRALFGPDWSPDVYNAGTITASAARTAWTYSTWDSFTHLVNAESGIIEAFSQGSAIAVRMANGHGIILPNEGVYDPEGPLGPGSLINSGQIIARLTTGAQTSPDDAQAIAVHLSSGPGTFISILNTGLIEASAPDPATPNAQAIYMWGDVGGTIVNSGTIRGDYAIHEQSDNQWKTYDLTIENSGLIEGRIELTEGNDLIRNSGTIVGNVDLGENADTLINRGIITGEVALGTGNDVYDGIGGMQNGRVLGRDGADLLIGTAGADVLDGGAGADILIGGGGDVLTGGSGNDRFAFSSVSSGTTETITDFVTGVDVIDLRALAPATVTISGSTVTATTAAGSLVVQVNGTVALSDIITASTTSLPGSSEGESLLAGPVATSMQGLGGDDLLVGGSFNDLLDGGAGEDTMWGGLGDDTYVVDVTVDSTTAGDVVIECADAGTDLVLSSVNYTLAANVENLTLLGESSIRGLGNDLGNIITGNAGDNWLRGWGGDDQLVGGGGQDLIEGDSGFDTLTGGAGDDRFQGTIASFDGDTITDFSVGDKIVFLDASITDFPFLLSGQELTFPGGSLTFQGVIAGTLVGSVDPSTGGVQLTIQAAIVQDARSDFNGDGRSDILWRHDNGLTIDWLGQANGGFADNYTNSVVNIPTNWQVEGIGDFNGDGRDDILWRNETGLTLDWLGQSNGGFADNYTNSVVNIPTNWQVEGIGDFNGDGRDDILWRNETGLTLDWLGQANGGFADNYTNSIVNIPNNWTIAGIGDFNGDGRDDILWRNETGLTLDWLGQANGGFADNYTNSIVNIPNNWTIAGIGDFNGDGRDDILWRDDTGLVVDWLGQAGGGFADNYLNSVVNVPLAWQVAAIGDFNGDGRDDILWRNDNGTIANWLGQANGGFADNPNASVWVPTAWHVQVESLI